MKDKISMNVIEMLPYFDFSNGILTIRFANEEFALLERYLSDLHQEDSIRDKVDELKKLKEDPESVIERYWGWDNDKRLGYVAFIGGNEVTGRIYRKGEIIFIDSLDKVIEPLHLDLDGLIEGLERIAFYFECYEKEEFFSAFPDVHSLINEEHNEFFSGLGFRRVGQLADYVVFQKKWLAFELKEDKDGLRIFLWNKEEGQRYGFDMALNLLDWEAAMLYNLQCRKYANLMDKEEARIGILELFLDYLKSHFATILQVLDRPFFQKLETERQLQQELMLKVLALPKDHLLYRSLINGSPLWLERMRNTSFILIP